MRGESEESIVYLEDPKSLLFIEEELESYSSQSHDNLSDLLHRLIRIR